MRKALIASFAVLAALIVVAAATGISRTSSIWKARRVALRNWFRKGSRDVSRIKGASPP